MTNTFLVLLSVSSAFLAVTVGYALWVHIRVARLRIHLLEWRADLFDAVRRLDGLEDPAYQTLDRYFQYFHLIAPMISFPYLIHLFLIGRKYPQTEARTSQNPQIQAVIEQYRDLLDQRLDSY